MRHVFAVFVVIAMLSALVWSNSPVMEVDKDFRGDPTHLVSDGWIPLLNGKNLSGWRAQEGMGENAWLATRAVLFDIAKDPKALGAHPSPGDRILNGPVGKTVNLVTNMKHGDAEFYIEFLVPRGSNSGIYLHGLYEVQVFDSWGAGTPQTTDCGSIYHRWMNEKPVGGSAAKVNASRQPGQWQSFHIWFRAPRFDASGKKIANARFDKVLHNGVLVQQNVEVDGGTRAHMPIPEAALNPLMIQGDHGPVALRNLYYRSLP